MNDKELTGSAVLFGNTYNFTYQKAITFYGYTCTVVNMDVVIVLDENNELKSFEPRGFVPEYLIREILKVIKSKEIPVNKNEAKFKKRK